MILLGSKFVSKSCSIHHCFLRFFLSIFGCNKHTINFSLQGVNGGLQLTFGSHVPSIDCLHIVYCTTCISNVSLELALSTVSTIQKGFADARGAVNNMQTINGRDMTAKRQLESSIHTLQAEVDGMLVAAKNAEEKSKKAMVDAARLADELRAEQDHATSMGTAKNSLGNQPGELEGRLADAENAAMKGGKAAMAKMKGKIRELEAELASTQSRTGEAAKALQRAERKSKELAFAQGEDRKNQDRMSELAAKLQGKIKTYKQQIEE